MGGEAIAAKREEFVRAPAPAKLTNAAHYEVVPRRMLGMGRDGYAYNAVTFTPAVEAPAPGPAPAAPAGPPP
jgi:hypothetical protein